MTTDIDRSDRYRLIPAHGHRKSWYVYGADEARKQAEEFYETTDIAVIVCSFPPGGLCSDLYMVPNRKRVRSRLPR